MDCKKLIAGITSLLGAGTAMAHGASYDHTHTLPDSPAIVLCLVVCAGVIAAMFKSSAQSPRAIPIEIDQRHKRTIEDNR